MSGSSQLKQQVLDVVEALPADATIEDAIERLVFLAKVERGLTQAATHQGVPHDEMVKRFSQ